MAKQISIYQNRSLEELEWTADDIVAFDSSDIECPQPFLLAIPERIITKRNKLESIIEKLGLGFALPSQLKLKV